MHSSRRTVLGWLGLGTAAVASRTLAGCAGVNSGGRPDAGGGFDSGHDGGYQAPDSGYHVPDTDAGEMCLPTRPDAQGPFFVPGAPNRMAIADANEPGDVIHLIGRVVEDDCVTPIAGALLDVWQADATGAYHAAGTDYRLRGQVLSDANGAYGVQTIRPGYYENGPGAWRPAHIHFTASKPGFATVTTQLYFAGDPYLSPNDGCPGCGSDDADRIIALQPGEGGVLHGQWRIVLRRL